MLLTEQGDFNRREKDTKDELPSEDLVNQALGLLNSAKDSAVLKTVPMLGASLSGVLQQALPKSLMQCVHIEPKEQPSELTQCVAMLPHQELLQPDFVKCSPRLPHQDQEELPSDLVKCVAMRPHQELLPPEFAKCSPRFPHQEELPSHLVKCVAMWPQEQLPSDLAKCVSRLPRREQSPDHGAPDLFHCVSVLPDYTPFRPRFESIKCVHIEPEKPPVDQRCAHKLPDLRPPVDIHNCVSITIPPVTRFACVARNDEQPEQPPRHFACVARSDDPPARHFACVARADAPPPKYFACVAEYKPSQKRSFD